MTGAGWSPETAPDRLGALLDRLETESGPRGIYTSVFAKTACTDAERARGCAGPLAGALISVKGLFDVAGEAFNRLNLLVLRNTTLANIADGCGIALPYREGGTLLSAMLIAARDADEALLATAAILEPAMRPD